MTSPEKPDNVIANFLKLYNEARKEHYKYGVNATIHSPANGAAIKYANDHGLQGVRNLLKANALTRNGKTNKAWKLVESILNTVPRRLRGQAHHIRGFVYRHRGEHDKAIVEFERALASPGYDTRGNAFSSLGVIYRDKGEFTTAISWLKKALRIPNYDRRHLTLLELASTLRQQGRLKEALEQVDLVLGDKVDVEGERNRAEVFRRVIKAELAEVPANPADLALAQVPVIPRHYDSPESHMCYKLFGKEDKYAVYITKKRPQRADTFSVLRGWSSAVTLLEGGGDNQWRGGGYFLKWDGFGIVIDPGFDFVDNFHDAGFHARDLDAVLVSHDHADHNFDLRSLDDLRYEVYRRSKEPLNDGTENRRPTLRKTQLIIDEDTAKSFGDGAAEHRGPPMKFAIADCYRRRWIPPGDTGLPLTVEHFPVQHGQDVPHAVGMRLRLYKEGQPPFMIGYTADTKYFDGLADELVGCDLLVAHISQPEEEEFIDENHLKLVHLGYNGVTKLIRAAKPKLTLIGEFWAGLADLRIDLINGLRRRTGTNAILPTGLGFHIHIPSMEVECTECRKATPYSQIRIAPPSTEFGPLGFLCNRCLV